MFCTNGFVQRPCLPFLFFSAFRAMNRVIFRQHAITLNTSLEESLAAFAGPDPVMVARGIVIADGTVASLLGRLHGHVSFFTITGQSLSATLASIIRIGPGGRMREDTVNLLAFEKHALHFPLKSKRPGGCRRPT